MNLLINQNSSVASSKSVGVHGQVFYNWREKRYQFYKDWTGSAFSSTSVRIIIKKGEEKGIKNYQLVLM